MKSADFRLPTSLSYHHPRLQEVGASAPTLVRQRNVLPHCPRGQLHQTTTYFLNCHITHSTWVQGVASKQLTAATSVQVLSLLYSGLTHTPATLSTLQRKWQQIGCRGTNFVAQKGLFSLWSTHGRWDTPFTLRQCKCSQLQCLGTIQPTKLFEALSLAAGPPKLSPGTLKIRRSLGLPICQILRTLRAHC